MDSTKKVLKKFAEILTNQQKIINKLAQHAGVEVPPASLKPSTPSHDVIMKLQEAAPQLMSLVEVPNSKLVGNEVQLKFKPGATQSTVAGLQAKLTELVNKNLVAGGPFVIKPI